MRHRTLACVGAVVLGLAVVWPAPADAQHRRGGATASGRSAPTASRPGPRTGSVAVSRPTIYSRGPYYSRYYYPRGYYPFYYSPYYRYPSFSLYWGWGYPWYPYYDGWGYPYPYGWGPYRPWYGYYYRDDYSSVRVQAKPRDARVYVDGYFVGIVDDFDGTFQRLRLPPGGHEITLHLNGYRNVAEKLYLQPSSTYRMRAALEPLPAGAAPEPEPKPNPEAVKAMQPERGEEAEGREPEGPPSERWPPRQQAEERQREQREQQRERQPRDSRFGTLAIRVQPADAEVIVDDTPWRGGADESGAISIQVPSGAHQIEVRREGYASFITTVDVRPGVSTPLNVMLQREN